MPPQYVATLKLDGGAMVRRWFWGFVVASMLAAGSVHASSARFYRFDDVKKLDDDLYGNRDYLFKTEYCYHYSYGESVVVKWEGSYSYDNRIIWEDDDDPCELEGIYER